MPTFATFCCVACVNNCYDNGRPFNVSSPVFLYSCRAKRRDGQNRITQLLKVVRWRQLHCPGTKHPTDTLHRSRDIMAAAAAWSWCILRPASAAERARRRPLSSYCRPTACELLYMGLYESFHITCANAEYRNLMSLCWRTKTPWRRAWSVGSRTGVL